MFVPGKPFQPSLIFVGNARTQEWSTDSYYSRVCCGLTNIRLGWKGLPGTNPLAYLQKIVNHGRKKVS